VNLLDSVIVTDAVVTTLLSLLPSSVIVTDTVVTTLLVNLLDMCRFFDHDLGLAHIHVDALHHTLMLLFLSGEGRCLFRDGSQSWGSFSTMPLQSVLGQRGPLLERPSTVLAAGPSISQDHHYGQVHPCHRTTTMVRSNHITGPPLWSGPSISQDHHYGQVHPYHRTTTMLTSAPALTAVGSAS